MTWDTKAIKSEINSQSSYINYQSPSTVPFGFSIIIQKDPHVTVRTNITFPTFSLLISIRYFSESQQYQRMHCDYLKITMSLPI